MSSLFFLYVFASGYTKNFTKSTGNFSILAYV